MKSFAALSGLFIAAILLVGGYAMAYWHGDWHFVGPLVLAVAAALLLPLLYWLKAARRLSRPLARIAFICALAGLAAVWIALFLGRQPLEEFAIPLAIFSAVWLVASLPLLRAGIRHRP